jgi:hypothetical protein
MPSNVQIRLFRSHSVDNGLPCRYVAAEQRHHLPVAELVAVGCKSLSLATLAASHVFPCFFRFVDFFTLLTFSLFSAREEDMLQWYLSVYLAGGCLLSLVHSFALLTGTASESCMNRKLAISSSMLHRFQLQLPLTI